MRLAIHSLVILILLLPSAVLAQTVTDVECLAIVDDAGNRIGRPESGTTNSEYVSSWFDIDGIIVYVTFDNVSQSIYARSGNLYYASAGCPSGEFPQVEATVNYTQGASDTRGSDLFVTDLNAPVNPSFAYNSVWGGGNCYESSGTVSASTPIVYNTNILPAVSWPVHIESEPCFQVPNVAALGSEGLLIIALSISTAALWFNNRRRFVVTRAD